MTQPTSQERPQAGTILGDKYRLIHEIAVGGISVVYEAEQLSFKKRVAIKVMQSQFATDDFLRERFLAEAQASATIAHANVIDIYDQGECPNGAPFLVMELLVGETIGELIAKGPRLPVSYACELVLQALAGLAASHRHGIIHRDLKPDNIVVTHPSPARPLVKIVDFGLAEGLTATPAKEGFETRTWGTPRYTAPEQVLGDPVDARTDLFSLGVILYELLAGSPPHLGANPTQIFGAMFKQERLSLIAQNASVSKALANLVERALAVKPEFRFASADEFATALAPFATPHSSGVSLRALPINASFGASNIQITSQFPARLLQKLASLRPRITDSLLRFPQIPKAPGTPGLDLLEGYRSDPPDAEPIIELSVPPLSDASLLGSARAARESATRTIDSSRQLNSALLAAGTGFGAGLLLAHLAGLI